MPYIHVVFFKSNQALQHFLDNMQSINAAPPLTVVESRFKERIGDPFVILESEEVWSQQEDPLICQFTGILHDDFNQSAFKPERYGMALSGTRWDKVMHERALNWLRENDILPAIQNALVRYAPGNLAIKELSGTETTRDIDFSYAGKHVTIHISITDVGHRKTEEKQ